MTAAWVAHVDGDGDELAVVGVIGIGRGSCVAMTVCWVAYKDGDSVYGYVDGVD